MKTIPAAGASGSVPDPILNPLILDLLDWLTPGPRPYAEVMDVWRTSCPRLPIWEDAVDSGLVVRRHDERAGVAVVSLTADGRRMLDAGRGRA
jgi:D-3-phosphoglycerate dehydrogenase